MWADNYNVSGIHTNSPVGVGTSVPGAFVDIHGGLNVVGVITATSFSGINTENLEPNTLVVAGISTFSGTVDIDDDQRLRFGAGQDLEIYHNSTNNNSVIQENGSGNLNINANNFVIRNAAANESKAKFSTDGSVILYFDNVEKIKTIDSGILVTGGADVSGVVTATSFSGSGANLTGLPAGYSDLDAALFN